MKSVAVFFGICLLLATNIGEAVARAQKSSSRSRSTVAGRTVVRKSMVAPVPSLAGAHHSSNQHPAPEKCGKASRATKVKTALASKFNAVSAVDQHKPADDPTWAPIDVSDLNHLSE